MLTLEAIFKEHATEPAKRKVVFEEGLWCIYERIPQAIEGRFHLIHRCKVGVYATQTKNYPDGTPYDIHCRLCGSIPSDGILGLHQLQKWGMGDTSAY